MFSDNDSTTACENMFVQLTDASTSSAPVASCEDALYIWNISQTPFIIKRVCYSEKLEEMG